MSAQYSPLLTENLIKTVENHPALREVNTGRNSKWEGFYVDVGRGQFQGKKFKIIGWLNQVKPNNPESVKELQIAWFVYCTRAEYELLPIDSHIYVGILIDTPPQLILLHATEVLKPVSEEELKLYLTENMNGIN